jgi:hypothetical protein
VEVAVVPTKAISKRRGMGILGSHVPALEGPQEGWQAAPLLECGGEQARCRRPRGATARSVSGRDQLDAGACVAALDRGVGGRRRAAPHAVVVSRGSLRRRAGGRFDRAAAAVAGSAGAAAAVGRLLADLGALAAAGARPVLVGTVGGESQGDALGGRAVRAGRLSAARAWQRVALAPGVVRAQRAGRSAGRGRGAVGDPRAVPLP